MTTTPSEPMPMPSLPWAGMGTIPPERYDPTHPDHPDYDPDYDPDRE